ncbi:MAG TPA: 50S ribosomal protein L4 [Candidatus Gracilibacteria bacterium]|nr:50S ribosomal protein L4 [Candidatus Gracilibacteria bacterium]
MLKVDLYNQTGEKKGQVSVPAEIFGVKFKADLVHQALVRQLSNARPGVYAHTKTKGEVNGTGKKPFRQKGTGNARQGSLRNPHNPGGGIALGPRNTRNYEKLMPKKQRRLALFSALSAKYNEGKIMALDKYENKDIKTKDFMGMLHKLPIEKDVLVIIGGKNELIEKSSRNLPFVKTLKVNYLNIADLQKYDNVLFLEEAIEKLSNLFLSNARKEKQAASK